MYETVLRAIGSYQRLISRRMTQSNFNFKNNHYDCKLERGQEADVRLEAGDAIARREKSKVGL